MKTFRVEVLGTGFSTLIQGVPTNVGFLCVRFVRASSEAEARELALEMVRNLDGFRTLVADQDAGTRHALQVDEVEDLGESPPGDAAPSGTGPIFFDERL